MRTLALLLLLVVPGADATARPGPRGTAAAVPARPTAGTAVDGAWVSPTGAGPPVVLAPFRPPASRWGAGHRGVDLAAAAGSVVRAAGDGVVVFAGVVAGRPVVSVDHPGGLRTTYEPVLARVGAGRPVSRGDPLGTLQPGHPGCAPAVCLHWGARTGPDSYVDPMALLRPPRLRLEPWDG